MLKIALIFLLFSFRRVDEKKFFFPRRLTISGLFMSKYMSCLLFLCNLHSEPLQLPAAY